MKAVVCQLDVAWEDAAANRALVRQCVTQAKLDPGSLVVLPEMFASGFSMNSARAAERPEGESEAFLSGLARELEVYVVAGLAVRTAAGAARNQALAWGPDGQLRARYTKLHPFSLGGEHQHYEAGDEPASFDWGGLRVAPFVCYDLRFPEIFRVATLGGAQVLVVIANWPAVRIEHWIVLLRARAIENQAFVIGVNRCGHDPVHRYPGRSLIIDPLGAVLMDAGELAGVAQTTLPISTLHQWRQGFPALRDARPEFLPRPHAKG